jgi:AraC-like DNA-binding protein
MFQHHAGAAIIAAGARMPTSCHPGPYSSDCAPRKNDPRFYSMKFFLPAIHALELLQVVERWNVSTAELLAGLDLTESELADPSARLPLPTYQKLVERARHLSGEPGLGFSLGLQMRISVHGTLGMAAMTASTIREALDIAVRFAPTRTNALTLRLTEEAKTVAIVIEEQTDLGSARDVLLFALVVGIWQIGNAVTGTSLSGDGDFRFSEPPYFKRFAGFVPGRVRFDQPANRIVFDASVLDLPLVMADPVAQKVARRQCEQALEALGQEGQFVSRVRLALTKEGGSGYRSVAEVAQTMHVSERTLKRRLTELGKSFSELVDEQRRDHAMLLMATPDMSLEEVALRLGYSDAANFTRAFRRWTGKSPSAHRKGLEGN